MNLFPFNRHIRRLSTYINALVSAVLIGGLIGGLIPPPALTHLAQTVAPAQLEPLTEAAVETAVELIEAPAAAYAAPGDNLALAPNGMASQIDTAFGGDASRGNDGNTDGNYGNNSVTHTSSTTQPWWEVDLGSSQFIGSVVVWNRTDGGAGPAIDNSYILVSDTPFTADDVATARTQAKFEFHLTSANRPSPSTSATVDDLGRYVRVHSADNGQHLHLAEVQVIEGTPPYGPGDIVGTVYNDLSFDGAPNGEPGIEGVLITAATSGGTFTDTTDANGDYAFSGLTGNARVEITFPTDGSLDFFEPTVAGGTFVQFVDTTNGVGGVDFGINRPFDYCQANPTVCTAVQRNGDHSGDTSYAIASTNFDRSGSIGTVAQQQEVGSVWGIAYKAKTEQLFTSAFVKRHVGLGSAGLGGIYAINDPAGAPSPAWTLDLTAAPFNIDFGPLPDNATRGLGAAVNSASRDADAFDAVGKQGLGDIDLSEDGNDLWAINLYSASPTSVAGSLLKIDVTNVAIPTSVQQFPLDGIAGLPTCTNGILRPWALKLRFGKGYLGAVCTAEGGGTRTDLHAYVLSFDPANPNAGMTLEVDIDMTYTKGSAWNNTSPAGAAGVTPSVHSTLWYPWESTYSRTAFNVASHDVRLIGSHPTPILSDIDFDSGDNMILGFVDRSGHQFGAANQAPTGSDFLDYVSGGDVLRACIDAGGSWQLESAGACGGVTGGGLNGEGIGGGEFYSGEFITTAHMETSQGGLAQHPAADLLVLSAMDPIAFNSGGLIWLSNNDGSKDSGQTYYSGGNNASGYFSKSNGMGDVEILCDEAPVEVGNRVWEDTDADGIQDPDEAGINNVQVTLHNMDNGGAQVGAAQTTSGNGDYLFTGLDTSTNYQARVSLSDAEITNRSLFITTQNADGQGTDNNNKTDLHDSDGDNGGLNIGFSTIAFTTGGPGQNNHTLDFGFSATEPPMFDIVKLMNTPPTVTVGSPISFTIRITNTGSVTITSLPLTDTFDSTYLAFNTIADATGPNQSTTANSNSVYWADVTTYDGNGGELIPNEVLDIIVVFDTIAATTGIAPSECATTGNTYNKATVMGLDACVEIPIDPAEPKLTLGDIIWHDINNNGTQETNELGIDGVILNLYEVTGSGNSLISSTTTISNGVNGFYEFDVESGKDYMVEVAASNFDPGRPLAGFVVANGQPLITGTTAATRTEANVTTNVDTSDFGFYCRFDLALDKKLAAGQAATIAPGDNVTFTITVYNQGIVTATNVTVADYIPSNFTLSDGSWNGAGTTVTRTLGTTLTPSGTVNSSATVDIVLTAGAALSGTYTNTAEIAAYTTSVVDGNGTSLPDADSTPGADGDNGAGETTNLVDDEVNEDGKNGGDEDDHDPAVVTVSTVANPSIAVDKQFNGVGDYRVGETISFTIRITNTGDVVIDTLPLEDRYSGTFITYQSAVPAHTTAVDGIITWADLLASDGNGLGVGEAVSVDVFFTTATDTTLLPAVAPCTQPGHAPNLARSVGATAGATSVMQDGDDSSCDSVQILNPTAVQLAERSMIQTPDGVLVRWSTVSEGDIVGFHIWMSNGTEAQLRSSEMIVATSAGQSSDASYRWLDAGATLGLGDAYVLEVVKNDGSTERVVIDVMSDRNIFLPLVVR